MGKNPTNNNLLKSKEKLNAVNSKVSKNNIKPEKRLRDVIGILEKPRVSGKGLSLSKIRKIAYSKIKTR